MKEFISVDEAQDIVRSATFRTEQENVPLQDALNRVLSVSVAADAPIPMFDNSAMDGYAVRREDVLEVPSVLQLMGEVAAGSWPRDVVEHGQCIRIMTGAPLPPGADCVVPVEWTDQLSAKDIRIDRTPGPFFAIRRTGEDVAAGTEVLAAGTFVSPPVVGMLASLGQSQCRVARQPGVSIISTGTEIVDYASVPQPGQVRNSNGPALRAQTEAAGGRVQNSATVGDDADGLRRRVLDGLRSDILVLSGGVSVGAYDLVQEVLRGVGVNLLFWKVRQRPGKPLLFGIGEASLVFGLPGNPVSASVCFDQYVRPAIHAMLGRITPDRHRFNAILAASLRKVRGLQYFARGIHDWTSDGARVAASGSQGSGVYSAMADATCIIHLPEEMVDPQVGTSVVVEPFSW